MDTHFNSRNESFRCFSARGPKKINCDNLGKAPFQPDEIDLILCAAVTLDLPLWGNLGEETSFLSNLFIFSSPGCLEQSFHFIIGEPIKEMRSHKDPSLPPSIISRNTH